LKRGGARGGTKKPLKGVGGNPTLCVHTDIEGGKGGNKCSGKHRGYGESLKNNGIGGERDKFVLWFGCCQGENAESH